jgi:hypothetical protein
MLNKSFKKIFLTSLFVSLLFLPFLSLADEVFTITATVEDPGATPTPSGGGGSPYIPVTSVRFSGQAYPDGKVFLVKNRMIIAEVSANNLGEFSITLEEKTDRNILYSLYAVDSSGAQSIIMNYPVYLNSGYLTHLSGILFPPTINLDKYSAYSGDDLSVFGSAIPERALELKIEGKDIKTFDTISKKDGTYNIKIPLFNFHNGQYKIYIKYKEQTLLSKVVPFELLVENKVPEVKSKIPGDCNFDAKINLVDFSILSFWYKKKNPPACLDVNHDKIINLVDFSIFAYHWTG